MNELSSRWVIHLDSELMGHYPLKIGFLNSLIMSFDDSISVIMVLLVLEPSKRNDSRPILDGLIGVSI